MKKIFLAIALLFTPPVLAVSNFGTTATLTAVGAVTDCTVGGSGSGANTKASTIAVPTFAGAVGIDASGTFSATVSWAGSTDGLTYFNINTYQSVSGALSSTTTVPLRVVAPATGLKYICAYISAFTSGSTAITMEPIGGAALILNLVSSGSQLVAIKAASDGTLYATPAASNTVASGIGGFQNDAVTTVVQIKGSAGDLFQISATNTTAATAYAQVFCLPSASVTLGTTPPDYVIRLKTNAGAGDARDIFFPIGLCGSAKSGLSVAGTTTATGAVTAAVSIAAAFY